MNNIYVLIDWPEVQELMEEDWFDSEAILADPEIAGISAFLIPESRLINNTYILERVEELSKQLEATQKEENYIYSEWENSIPFEGGMNTFESVLNLKLSLDEMQSKV